MLLPKVRTSLPYQHDFLRLARLWAARGSFPTVVSLCSFPGPQFFHIWNRLEVSSPAPFSEGCEDKWHSKADQSDTSPVKYCAGKLHSSSSLSVKHGHKDSWKKNFRQAFCFSFIPQKRTFLSPKNGGRTARGKSTRGRPCHLS